ncbi:hypothetical protein E2986_12572 [Frieseomelitta varia]|uniref:Uncharacterized protein n=1 Tax=Frieseomelitta varia TaxID=561572 RepID=A0A833SLP7_9HYME|nr:hypothetical protein E2986_12572 [Frieseomelitta varia]
MVNTVQNQKATCSITITNNRRIKTSHNLNSTVYVESFITERRHYQAIAVSDRLCRVRNVRHQFNFYNSPKKNLSPIEIFFGLCDVYCLE